jgi:ATP-binding cassette subfamily B protein
LVIPSLQLPEAVRSRLETLGTKIGPIHLSIDTDVSLDGHPSREWLVVTDQEVLVVGEGAEAPRQVPWKDICQVRTTAGVGGGTLQVKEDGDWVDLLRFSNALATRFHKVSRAMERQREVAEGKEGAPANGDKPPLEEVLDGPLDPPRCPSCALRLATKEESCPRCMQKGQILKRVTHLLKPYTRGALLLTLLTLLGVAAELLPPKLQQYMVDDILSEKAQAQGGGAAVAFADFRTALLVVVLALAFSRLMLSAVGWMKGRLATKIGSGLTDTLRKEMVEKLQTLSVAYYDRHQVGSMISRVAHDSEVMQGLMHQITGGFLLQIVQLVGVGAMLVWINPKLALFTLIPVPLVLLGSWVFWRYVYPRHYRLWDASSKQMTVLSGMLSGIRVVKAFAQESREKDRFNETSGNLTRWRLWVDATNSTYGATMQLVFGLGGLIVWYVGGRDVIGDQMTLGQLIAFLAYLAMFYAPLGALSNFTTWLTSFLSGSKRVLELLDTPVTIQEPQQPVGWNDPKGAIRFDHVTFGYDRNQPVLKDVSFEVAPGEMIGIVGRSGSGKTTLVNLLGRFYEAQEGAITVDGIDIRHLASHELRERLGIVFQDSFLFRGTIWKNLAYGRPDATLERGLEAAKAAGAHDFICRQPLAYDTLLGESGAGLSGGEKQRLSIARTLLYDPRILVLDEATSSIDAEAEKSIQEALAVLVKGRTTIAIAHRLSTLRNADRIFAFDRGRLAESGTHAELLDKDGLYARLVKIQTQVTKKPTVDTLLAEVENKDSSKTELADGETLAPARNPAAIVWLDAATHAFRLGQHDRIELWKGGERVGAGVFLVRAFPASHPEAYLSVRGWNDTGDEIELGMIRTLQGWEGSGAEIARVALGRRALIRTIRRVHSVKLAQGYLDFDVDTEVGRQRFVTRWTQGQAVEFGQRGKMIIDTEENRYAVPDVDALPRGDREKFLQYVYW